MMKLVFDFGSRPIRAIESKDHFRFVHNKEGWTIAETTQALAPNTEDEVFTVWDAEGEFIGSVVNFGNLATIVAQIYDQQYGPKAIPIEQEKMWRWVVFAEQSDGENTATFSREVNAPNLETAEERFLSVATQGADFPPNDVEIITVYGPYVRA